MFLLGLRMELFCLVIFRQNLRIERTAKSTTFRSRVKLQYHVLLIYYKILFVHGLSHIFSLHLCWIRNVKFSDRLFPLATPKTVILIHLTQNFDKNLDVCKKSVYLALSQDREVSGEQMSLVYESLWTVIVLLLSSDPESFQ